MQEEKKECEHKWVQINLYSFIFEEYKCEKCGEEKVDGAYVSTAG